MKKITLIFLLVLFAFVLTACGSGKPSATVAPVVVDYPDAASLESALNAGANVEGKTVTFTVTDFIPQSAFGYNLVAGEHLNFCSQGHPNAGIGDTLTVKIDKVASALGSWIINYTKQ